MTTTTPPTERVGRYQLLEPIGIGPSGAVSRAKVFGVAGFERQFAVKRFHAELTATASMAAMLSAAARAYGSLEHPRIARMSEFGVAQGSTFTAVEYVPGLDALRLIAEARLAGSSASGLVAGGALALVSQAARAVGYAHGRGLTHLGLAPTNVIVTADGDIKITDFGILSATLPQRPIDVPRLAQRIPYLAPEQLANEATSAATDVFALGVLAYELVTGTRTFKGDTPQQVASAIMAGPPAEPPLPRPIVRVLQRCLARSPFERFPDARALADALDAALRVAPVPGTRKDIGAQVKEVLDRLAALNEGQMSGMVALHLGTGPIRRLDEERAGAPAGGGPRAPDPGSAPYELSAPDPAAGGPPSFGGANTLSDLPRPMTTVPGLPPPPIPVPPGLGPPSIPSPPGAGTSTLLGMGKTAPPPASAKPRAGSVGGIPPVPGPARRAATQRDVDPVPGPAPGAPGGTSESAVHTLDPSDLLSIDALTDDGASGEAGAGDGDLGGATLATPHADEITQDAAAALPAEASADDFGDAPTHALAGAAAAARVAGRERATTYRLDPSSIDTKPIPPVTLEPLLFDPIVRADEPSSGSSQPERRRPVLDEDRWFDEPSANRAAAAARSEPGGSAGSSGSGRIAASPAPASSPGSGRTAIPGPMPPSASGRTAIPGPAAPSASGRAAIPGPMPPSASGRAATSTGASPPGAGRAPSSSEVSDLDSKLGGQTILGFGAPPSAQRATPPSPFPPAASLPPDRSPEDELPVPSLPPERNPAPEPPTDQLSELMLEGFRTGPAPEALEVASGWQEPSAIAPAPVSPDGSPQPGWAPAPPPPAAPISAPVAAHRGRRAIWIAVGMVGAVAVAIGAWQLYARAVSPPAGRGPGITSRPDAPQASQGRPGATRNPGATPESHQVPTAVLDAGQVATVAPDAGRRTAPSDAGPDARPRDARTPADTARVAVAPHGPPSGPGDSLAIASTPAGARVFLDGADSGVTPLKLPGSPDRHTIALLLAGHELYVAQVDGHGTFQIPLKEVTPTNGPAGIKVLRCKDKDRYYVYVDGMPSGQTCPTERIGCELGPHTVEVYDVVSETRRKWDVVVKETRLSYRVRVE